MWPAIRANTIQSLRAAGHYYHPCAVGMTMNLGKGELITALMTGVASLSCFREEELISSSTQEMEGMKFS